MSNAVLSFIGWSFLPDLVTSYTQRIYYAFAVRAGDPKPAPGSPRHALHRRRIYTFVILAYLLYILIEAHWEIRRTGDFYADLGVPVDVEERALQSRFRKLTLQHHPDKLPPHERAASEAYYVHLKLARDTLLDPAKRFAYDRFGPGTIQWQGLVTLKEFLFNGLRTMMLYYIGGGFLLVMMGLFGFGQWGVYWRYVAFAGLAVFELQVLTRPTFPSLFSPDLLPDHLSFLATSPTLEKLTEFWTSSFPYLTRPYLPFQTLQVAHKASIALFIALSRLGPILEESLTGVRPPAATAKGNPLQQQVERLERSTAANAMEASRLLALETIPFQTFDAIAAQERATPDQAPAHDQEPGTRMLQVRMRDWLVTNTVRNDPAVKAAVARVVQRRRDSPGAIGQDVLAAAKGNADRCGNGNIDAVTASSATTDATVVQGAGGLEESFADLGAAGTHVS